MCEGWYIDIFRFQKNSTKAAKNGFVTEIQGIALQIFYAYVKYYERFHTSGYLLVLQ